MLNVVTVMSRIKINALSMNFILLKILLQCSFKCFFFFLQDK